MPIIKIMSQLGMDGRGFRSGLQQAENTAKGFVRKVGGYFAGMFSIAVIGRAINQAVKNASRIEDMSRSLGLSVEQFQEMEFAASQTGASMETVGMAIKKIAQAQQEALTGKAGNEAARTFERLGISLDQLKGMSPQQIFLAISQAVRDGNLGLGNMADILDVMGKQSNTLFPAMQDGFAGMAQSARQLGLVIEEDIITKMADMEDQLDILKMKWSKTKTEAISELIPILENIWAGMVGAYGYLTEGFKGRGPEAAAQAWEAAWEMANEEDAATKEVLAVKRAQRAKRIADALAIEAGSVYTPVDRITKATAISAPSDALARIGGFVGGAGRSRQLQVAEQQLRKLDSIEDYVRRVVFGVL